MLDAATGGYDHGGLSGDQPRHVSPGRLDNEQVSNPPPRRARQLMISRRVFCAVPGCCGFRRSIPTLSSICRVRVHRITAVAASCSTKTPPTLKRSRTLVTHLPQINTQQQQHRTTTPHPSTSQTHAAFSSVLSSRSPSPCVVGCRFGRWKSLFSGLVILAVATALYGMASSVLGLYVASGLHGASLSFIHVSSLGLLSAFPDRLTESMAGIEVGTRRRSIVVIARAETGLAAVSWFCSWFCRQVYDRSP